MRITKNNSFSVSSMILITGFIVMVTLFGCDISDHYKKYFVAVGDIPPKSLVDTAFNRLLDLQIKDRSFSKNLTVQNPYLLRTL